MSRTSVRSKTVFACTECGAQAPKWLGRCPECGSWSSLVEERPAAVGTDSTGAPNEVMALVDLDPNLLIVTETALPAILDRVVETAPDVLAIDSIQTVLDPDLTGVPGSVGQVRECAHRLVRIAKERSIATILVGHVTKEGALAG